MEWKKISSEVKKEIKWWQNLRKKRNGMGINIIKML